MHEPRPIGEAALLVATRLAVWMNVGLEMARCSSSFLRPRLTDLIANPLQTELHPLQMPKRNVITALLIEAATWSAR